MPITTANIEPRLQLEEIRRTFIVLLAKESTLRAKRNESALAAVAGGASVTHLALAGGISRELLHRILRSATPAAPEAGRSPSGGDGVEALTSIQKSLDAAASKRAAQAKRRAVAIRGAVDEAGVTRTQIARWAGVSLETVRKVCLDH